MCPDRDEIVLPAATEKTHQAKALSGLPRQYASSELFSGENEVIIVHAKEHYRLRITRLDKLILTK